MLNHILTHIIYIIQCVLWENQGATYRLLFPAEFTLFRVYSQSPLAPNSSAKRNKPYKTIVFSGGFRG